MADTKVALITGCSSGGLGAALAIALKKAGYRVVATARNTKKLDQTRTAGIEDLELDVLSSASISSCVANLTALTGRLDLLINNAGAAYNMPVADIAISQGKQIFDINVWSLVSITQAFLPLLLKSPDAKIVNNISIGAYLAIPCQATYHASKAAANSLTETMRLELKPFGVKVIALMTGSVNTNFFSNLQTDHLPEDSIYRVVPGGLTMVNEPEKQMTQASDMDAETWATQVVGDLVRVNPPVQIWRGSNVTSARIACHLPQGLFDNQIYQRTKFDEVEKALQAAKK